MVYIFIITVMIILSLMFFKWFSILYRGYLFKKLSENPENSSENLFLQGNFAPIHREISVENLSIDGTIPHDLKGIYMRNGPNPDLTPITYTWPLDGDGMLHAIYIENGKASYRNRYVTTKGLKAERKAGKALYGGVGRPGPTDPRLIGKNGDPGPVKDGAFIHIIKMAEQFLAMYEGGPAYEVTEKLETVGEWSPTGKPFSVNAHTRLDPESKELFAFAYDLNPPYLRSYRFDNKGNLHDNIIIEKSHPTMMHDMAITQNYVIFFDCPVLFDMQSLSKTGQLLQWKPELGVKIGIMNKDTHTISWIHTEPFFVFHFVNAYEEAGNIVVDYIRYDRFAVGNALRTPPRHCLYRTLINMDILQVSHTQLDDRPLEFPRINEIMTTRMHRYIYMPETISNDSLIFNRLMKYDLQKREAIYHDFGEYKEIGEAVFIPEPLKTGEDEGFVGLFVYDKKENSSQFVLIHSQDFAGTPVAVIHLPQRVPHGLHGSWFI